jgi:ligand-binding sensor domain-containing protein
MTLKGQKLFIALIIMTTIWSCKGQNNVQNKETQDKSSSMGELVSELDEKIWDVYQDQKGNYWFGSNGKGVFHYDGEKLIKYTTEDGLIHNTIRGIQGDHLGNVFIETPEGISNYDGKVFTSLEPIIDASNEWKLEANDLWFNCNGNPNDIYRYDGEFLFELKLPRKNLYKAFGKVVIGLGFKEMNSSPYSVFGIDKDKKGNLWIGTIVAGAFRYDGKSFLWIAEDELSTLPDGRVPGVRSMIEDKDGYLWLSNFKSKYRIDDKEGIAQYERLEGVDVSKGLLQDRLPYFNSGLSDDNGDLWMTTYSGGVWKYDGEQLYSFPVKDGKKEVLLISIYKDNNGVLWLGTDNAGVYRFNGEAFEKFEPMKQ